MTLMSFSKAALFCLLLALGPGAGAAVVSRAVPHPLPSHPGNIFFPDENIVVPAPPGNGDAWRVVDYDNQTVVSGRLTNNQAEIGRLPVGWYKIVRGDKGYVTNRAFLGVLEPLRAPTPLTSPICMDVAMAWFYPKEKMGDVANLCALAGLNWVRDRLNWQHMEPRRGEFCGPNQYDDSAQIQHAAGLQILQVNHLSANWANPEARRFPPDLRDAYNFYREMARRWRGEIGAFEPWNEADIKLFGGHTGSEMASMQKAACLGLKAGNPDVLACQNVFAIRRASTLSDFRDNDAWPYFDTYNIHTYEPLENYSSVFADQRAVSAGRPIWITECSIHVKWTGDEQLRELSDADLQLQSERAVKTYAQAIHERAAAVFYFVLPHYTESQLQFGVLRADLTPRPAFLSIASTGRLLADARPLGRLKPDGGTIRGYLFDAKPDGQPAEVLVIWSHLEDTFELPKPPRACFDHIGRPQPATKVLRVTRAPLFVLLAKGSRPAIIPPPKPAKFLTGKPASVVLQAVLPETAASLNQSAYKITPGQANTVPVFAYNFGAKAVRGRLQISAPEHWTTEFPQTLEIAPGERKELKLDLTCPAGADLGRIKITGDFGSGGKPVLSMRFAPTSD